MGINKNLDIYFDYLRDIIYHPRRAVLDMGGLTGDEYREFAEALISFGSMVLESREFADNLSRGVLDVPLPKSDNELSSQLKALHSTLKHLTWQAKQVAEGDYDQHVGFMGEFSSAFNEMIAQLAERRRQMESEAERNKARLDELNRTNSIFEAITANMEEWIVMIDRETGEHLFANHPAASMLAAEALEKQLYAILFEYAASVPDDVDQKKEEFVLISDAALQYFEMTLYPIRWLDHSAIACVITDVTASKEEYSRLEDAAYKDVMTGVYNRMYGMKLLDEWSSEGLAFQLIFIDMDMLKYVNDVFGHVEGDAYIKNVADILQKVSGMATVSRLGGDEFMVLVQERDVLGRDINKVFEGLRTELSDSSLKDERGNILYNRSMSFGVVKVEKGSRLTTSDILAMADERMYEYKKAHKKERLV